MRCYLQDSRQMLRKCYTLLSEFHFYYDSSQKAQESFPWRPPKSPCHRSQGLQFPWLTPPATTGSTKVPADQYNPPGFHRGLCFSPGSPPVGRYQEPIPYGHLASSLLLGLDLGASLVPLGSWHFHLRKADAGRKHKWAVWGIGLRVERGAFTVSSSTFLL